MVTKVVVIGGGFAGVFAAKYLSEIAGDEVDIELISERNYFVFQPLLPEVASGVINSQDAVTPLRLLLPKVKVRLAEVRGIDTEAKTVQLVQGRQRILHDLPYDEVVIASGQITDLSMFKGFQQHSLTMKDLSDAYILRNKVISNFELADVTDNQELKERLLTFVVAGGGFSGVETMGELQEMIHRTLQFYPQISKQEIRLVLVQFGDRILMELPEKQSQYAHKVLEKRGVEIKLGTGVNSATSTSVTTNHGEVIPTTTVITTIGNGPSPFVKSLGLELNRGKIPTTRELQVEGVEHVWSLGDIAAIPLDGGKIAPPTAQATVREAKILADNLYASLQGKALKPFEYCSKGALASLGGYSAVGSMMGMNLYGLFAWFLWRGFYIAMLPGFATRVRVALNWMFDYFMPRTIVHMEQEKPHACRYMHFTEGDVVFNPSEWVDGFYVVVDGELRLDVESCDETPAFSRTFDVNDHWGERTIQNECMTTGTLTAVKDTIVMVIPKDDFLRMREAMPSWDEYFNNLDASKYSGAILEIERRKAG
ncbi:FAD-dependent oxidoreductase [Shewanella sp. 202IG2-18]|uniref:FAD-dependent oxidoreductase n=1 Tax=Parashewanella hymeniacidonis TaxID=2807618 RepID=UPI001960EB32|nr:FAD-dependent oxidoreductase [Parashewanella hymeniacidonis]MBM7074511.1 FAD-dependent oxidoreductase [Parashewanella hymeniacidonis]